MLCERIGSHLFYFTSPDDRLLCLLYNITIMQRLIIWDVQSYCSLSCKGYWEETVTMRDVALSLLANLRAGSVECNMKKKRK